MKLAFHLGLVMAVLAPAPFLFSQSEQVTVRELNQILAPVRGVSAAYSLDPLIAEAQATDSDVRIWGRAPGQAVIVLVHTDFTTSTMQVLVTQAPPILPDREWTGLDANKDSKGYYEVRVASNPIQVSDTFDYRANKIQLHFANAVAPDRKLPGVSKTWFPFTYLRFRADNWKLTLLDDNVDSSAISVNSTLLRGIHFNAGGLTIHAGYTSVAGFQSLFLPAHKQLISGATFAHAVSPDSQVGVTGYFIQRDPTAFDRQASQAVATMFFKRHTRQGTDLSAEVGLSGGVGGAVSLTHNTDSDEFHLAGRYRPRHYATSDTDNLNGLQGETRWNHIFGPHLASDLSGSATHIFAGPGAQTIEVATANLRYKAFSGISLSSGLSLSRFSDDHALFPNIHRFAVPIVISYDRPRFGVGAQYEYSQTSQAFAPGQAYRGSLRWSGQHLQLNANGGLDTQALGVDSVFSAFPDLNVELARLGLGTTTSIAQLAALLNDRAFLSSLGISPNATVQLVPRNWHGGLNLSWRSAQQILEMDSNYNLNKFLTQKNATVLQTVRYRRGLTSSTELVTSFTMLESVSSARRFSPVWEVGLRRQFGESPFPRWQRHDGDISGTVRLQDSSGTQPMRGVEITLDGEHKTTSDSQGRYHFSKVRHGVHTVQIAFKSVRPFWYTTPSKVSTVQDSVVDFGIIYPAAQLVGYVVDDAGAGLPDIGILVSGPQGGFNLITDQKGKFTVPVGQAGTYVVRVSTESVPDGYALEDLEAASVAVAEGEFKKVLFTLPVIRAVTGSVQKYDTSKGEYLPLAGVTVEIAELHRQTMTDGSGRYSFRNLPSGTFTMRVNGQEYGQIQFNTAPQLMRHDIRVSPNASLIARQ
ncbi:MAG TPA: carboxypeptidase regulatory-like domain-containing protein [Candidatus Angelobacter sp.]